MRRLRYALLAAYVLLLPFMALGSAATGVVPLAEGESLEGSNRIRLMHMICTSGAGGAFAVTADGCAGTTIWADTAGSAPSTLGRSFDGQTLSDVCAATIPTGCFLVVFPNR